MIFPVHSSAFRVISPERTPPAYLFWVTKWVSWPFSFVFPSLGGSFSLKRLFALFWFGLWLLLSLLFPSFCVLCVSFALLVLGSLCGSLCYWFETFCFSNVSIWCCQFPAQHCFAVSHTVWYVVFSASFIFHSFSVFFYFSWDFLFDLWIFFEVCCLVSKC